MCLSWSHRKPVKGWRGSNAGPGRDRRLKCATGRVVRQCEWGPNLFRGRLERVAAFRATSPAEISRGKLCRVGDLFHVPLAEAVPRVGVIPACGRGSVATVRHAAFSHTVTEFNTRYFGAPTCKTPVVLSHRLSITPTNDSVAPHPAAMMARAKRWPPSGCVLSGMSPS